MHSVMHIPALNQTLSVHVYACVYVCVCVYVRMCVHIMHSEELPVVTMWEPAVSLTLPPAATS